MGIDLFFNKNIVKRLMNIIVTKYGNEIEGNPIKIKNAEALFLILLSIYN